MKKLSLLLIALILGLSQLFAARMSPVTGRVVNEKGEAVEYATVVLLRDGQQVSGQATDTEGCFTLKVPTGEYTLSIQYLGYDPIRQTITLDDQSALGEFRMKSAATAIEGVVVKAQIIRREADRFVVDVANTPAAAGRDGIELLERAPGVWIDGDKITINGKSGSKVYINDRELRMESAQMLTYLRSLRSEEIQKIEVVPIVGADYDANASGGAIRITLKKRRENGLNGSVSMTTRQSDIQSAWAPNANINIHSGKLDFYASAWGYIDHTNNSSDERTLYQTRDASLIAHSDMTEKSRNFGGKAGAIYEINAKHSVGLEAEYYRDNEPSTNDSYTDLSSSEGVTRTDSWFQQHGINTTFSTSANYIWRIDTLGSTLKFLGDYTRRANDVANDNQSRIIAQTLRDSLYRDNSHSLYNIATATLALEKKFTPRWTLKAGAKYTYNDMRNNALYEYQKENVWVPNDSQSFAINYTENIAAAYAIASYTSKRLSFVAGLRAEYTHTYGKGTSVSQNYTGLFPNVNISYALNKEGSHSLIAQYARTISRPNFWALSPQRMQISDYTYQIGNPELEPAYMQDMSLTLVLKYKYTLTAGVQLRTGEIQQTFIADAENPEMLRLTWINFDRTKAYYLSANLPFQFTKWWSLNANLTYMRSGQRIAPADPERFYNFFFLSSSTTFSLPAKFYIDLSYNYQPELAFGEVWVKQQHRLNAGIKKRFGDRFVASFTVRNLLNERQHIGANGAGFTREVLVKQPWNSRTYLIGITYNFKSGKAFKNRSVEAGSEAEKGRL